MTPEAHTEGFEDLWLAPVERRVELPARALEGQLCFVQAEARVYVWLDGCWVGLVRD